MGKIKQRRHYEGGLGDGVGLRGVMNQRIDRYSRRIGFELLVLDEDEWEFGKASVDKGFFELSVFPFDGDDDRRVSVGRSENELAHVLKSSGLIQVLCTGKSLVISPDVFVLGP